MNRFVFIILSFGWVVSAHAALSTEKIIELCSDTEDTYHCARVIETEQLKSVPNNLARRGSGDEKTVLTIRLSQNLFSDPPQEIKFIDKEGKSYSVWDYWSAFDALLLLVIDGEESYYLWLYNGNGQTVRLPAEPSFSQDNKRIVTADFCEENCRNEIAIWQIRKGLPVKTRVWTPKEQWEDAEATWVSLAEIKLVYRVKEGKDYQEMIVSPGKEIRNKKELLRNMFR
ncbi:MAG: hypothetical protein LBS40_04190 [Burkholderiales bacterium]|jgi:hypothetical protein|nr:hypothetical protein [Burkholderiales bacterium]